MNLKNNIKSKQIQTVRHNPDKDSCFSGDLQLKILLVADPQLQGNYDESPALGFLTRWDADRYIKKANTFS